MAPDRRQGNNTQNLCEVLAGQQRRAVLASGTEGKEQRQSVEVGRFVDLAEEKSFCLGVFHFFMKDDTVHPPRVRRTWVGG